MVYIHREKDSSDEVEAYWRLRSDPDVTEGHGSTLGDTRAYYKSLDGTACTVCTLGGTR